MKNRKHIIAILSVLLIVASAFYAYAATYTATVRFHVNGGTITTGTAATRYRASGSIVQRSTDSGKTWSNLTNSVTSTATYYNLWNVATYGATRTGYHIDGTQAYGTTTTGGVLINQDNTAAGQTNPATTARMNGGSQITANKTITLYIHWIPNTLTITYNGNGATYNNQAGAAVTNQTLQTTAYNYGGTNFASYGLPNANGGTWNLIKPGYHATNLWHIGSATGATISADTNYATVQALANAVSKSINTANQTVTLYVDYAPNNYTVQYDANGGEGTTASSSHVYAASKALTANAFEKAGYHFTGWNTEADGSGTAYTDEEEVMNLTTDNNGTVTLYAQWEANDYTVNYDANGGEGSMSDSSHTYDAAAQLTANEFTYTGRHFTGWNTEADGSGTAYADEAEVTNLTTAENGTVTLYAQWNFNTYYIHYNANGGQGSMENSTHIYGTASRLAPNTFTKRGYSFDHWRLGNTRAANGFDDEEEIINLTDEHEAVLELYAEWSANEFTVSFDKNAADATGSMASQTFVFDSEQALTANSFQRSGYTFGGWSTEEDGSGLTFSDSQSITDELTGDTTLYAQWTPASKSIVTPAGSSNNANTALSTSEETVEAGENVTVLFTNTETEDTLPLPTGITPVNSALVAVATLLGAAMLMILRKMSEARKKN